MSPQRRPAVRTVVALSGAVLAGTALVPAARADQVVPDDLIAQGNLCVGLQCAGGEIFGSDTVRVKSDTPQLHFDDTSSAPGDPSNDWRLIANDGSSSYFALEDSTAGRQVVRISSGTIANALAVGANGNVGLGTASPALKLHLVQGDTPAMRMEQTSGSGFTPQTWDVAGNEANFFVRDVTGGSRLPFRIRPGAPTSSVDIGATGNVGVGTASPAQRLHVFGNAGTTRALVEEASTTAAPRVLSELSNKGPVRQRFTDTSTGATDWVAGTDAANGFVVAPDGQTLIPLTVDPSGTVRVGGPLTQNVAAADTENAQPVDVDAVLAALRTLPLTTAEYTADAANAKHLLPAASSFRTAFGLGAAGNDLSPLDVSAVALAAIKALDARVSALAASGVAGPKGEAGATGDRGAPGPSGTAVSVDPQGKRLKGLETSNRKLRKQLTSLSARLAKLERRK